MTTASVTTATSKGATTGSDAILPPGIPLLEDPKDLVEEADYSVARHLGLRPIAWTDDQLKGSHPDLRPCPSWCWIGQHAEYDHQVDPGQPWRAHHHPDFRIQVGAELYPGYRSGDHVTSATFEPNIEQNGQGKPIMRVGFRGRGADGGHSYEPDRLRLTIADAKDLIKALNFLVDLAEKG